MKLTRYLLIAGFLCIIFSALSCGQPEEPDLVELTDIIPDVVLDIRYATENNFVGEVLYPSARCFLMREPALALREVQADLKQQGFRLKVFDGYRPLSVQKRMWEILPDANYVADPSKGSFHNRGYSVDISLLDLSGNPVMMPTIFDDFSERAHADFMELPEEAIRHRRILRETMERHDFSGISSEWWHFNYKGAGDMPNLDIDIDELVRQKRARNQ